MPKKKTIKTWQQFSRDVRNKGCRLFDHLGDYPEPVLVTGCQRSGTTLLSQILRHSEGFVNFQTRKDDELDAALILCGREKFYGDGRYCFQTTYVNECYHEYFKYKANFFFFTITKVNVLKENNKLFLTNSKKVKLLRKYETYFDTLPDAKIFLIEKFKEKLDRESEK